MSIGVKVSGAWKDVTQASVRVSGAWKTVAQAYVRNGGVWEELLGSAPFSYSKQGADFSAATSASYNFTGLAIGAADSTRIVHLSVACGNAAAPSAVTFKDPLGGYADIPATIVASVSGSSSRTFAAYAAVPSGTTMNVTVAFTGSSDNVHVQAYAILNPIGAAPYDSASGSHAAGDLVLAVDIAASGCAIMCNAVCAAPLTYTGMTADLVSASSGNTHAFGSVATVGAVSGQNYAFNSCRAGTVLSWR